MKTEDKIAYLRELIERKAERSDGTVVRSMDDAVFLELMDIALEQERRIAELEAVAEARRP